MIDLARLENIKQLGEKLQAACPACRAQGSDRAGNHLVIFRGEDGCFTGRFACVANPGDSAHRKEIFAFVGIKAEPSNSRFNDSFAQNMRDEYAKRRAAEVKEKDIQEKVSEKLSSDLLQMLKPFRSKDWRANYFHESPWLLNDPYLAPAWLLQCLFKPSDIVWLGFREDSGSPRHRHNFKPLAEWMEHVERGGEIPPCFTAGTFKPRSFSRCRDNLTSAPFILVECDDIIGSEPTSELGKRLNKELSAALVGFLRSHGLNLRALIDTGNKSLHAIYDRPSDSELEALKSLAAGFRIDTGPIEQCAFSPLRLPGAIHDKSKRKAELLYLKPAQ